MIQPIRFDRDYDGELIPVYEFGPFTPEHVTPNTAVQKVTLPTGDPGARKLWICTSPERFADILRDVLRMNFAPRFEAVPLGSVISFIDATRHREACSMIWG